ncbi:MAG: 8-amino-7-oxononanoate synthase, partial [Nitrospira sp.]|nr:8-amino-7-oxononanoate synthase [Nitrospira sp.]
MHLKELEEELRLLKAQSLYRSLKRIDSPQSAFVTIDGKEYISLCSNNYLGLANHITLKNAAITATDMYGTGAAASRLISGNMSLHEQLECITATFKQTEDALVFNTGYMANTGTIQALASDMDAIFSDELNHASIIDGCRLSRAKVFIYKHRDTDNLRSLLSESRGYKRRVIITESVFSMDGDIAPLPDIIKVSLEFDAILIVDDAHATGVLGKNGRGSTEHFGIEINDNLLHIQMGTYSKALGSFGAYIAGPGILKKYLINKTRPFIYTTALPPAILAASIAAINLIQEDDSMLKDLWKNTGLFRERIKGLGFNTIDSETPIIPILIGSAEDTIKFSERLFQEGIFTTAIRPPTVPDG